MEELVDAPSDGYHRPIMWDRRSTYLFLPLALIVAIWTVFVVQGNTGDVDIMAVSIGLGWLLLALAIIDWRHLLLPDMQTLPLAVAGLIAIARLQPDALPTHVLAAAIGYVSIRIISFTYARLRGRDGLGQGDAKLMAVAGAWVGLSGLLSVVMIGAAAGLAIALVRAAVGAGLNSETRMPFGTFLCLGIWTTWLHGPLMLF